MVRKRLIAPLNDDGQTAVMFMFTVAVSSVSKAKITSDVCVDDLFTLIKK